MKQDAFTYRLKSIIAGKSIVFQARSTGPSEDITWSIDFMNWQDIDNSHGNTGDHAALDVLSFIKEALEKFIADRDPKRMQFTAFGKRAAVYKRMLSKITSYSLKHEPPYFVLTKN